MSSTNTPKQSAIRRGSQRAVRIGATASALAVILTGAVAGPAVAVPGEARRVHVEGQFIPVAERPEVYRVTGGLVGTYSLRSERVIYAWTYWTTKIQVSAGTESIKGCLDQNQNQNCDVGKPSGELRLKFNRRASVDLGTGRLIEGDSTHQVSPSARFSGGVLTTRDIAVHNSDEVVLTYEGDLEITQPRVNSKRAD
jgi:hypothetical protein